MSAISHRKRRVSTRLADAGLGKTSKKTVTVSTATVTQRKKSSGVVFETPGTPLSELLHPESWDRWVDQTQSIQRTPKTDYTYAKSGSYQLDQLQAGYISPNMSRRSLRGSLNKLQTSPRRDPPDIQPMSAPIPMMSLSLAASPGAHGHMDRTRQRSSTLMQELDAVNSAENNRDVRRHNSSQHQTHTVSSQTAVSTSSHSQQTEEIDMLLMSPQAAGPHHSRGKTRSSTRSGCNYGVLQRSGSESDSSKKLKSALRQRDHNISKGSVSFSMDSTNDEVINEELSQRVNVIGSSPHLTNVAVRETSVGGLSQSSDKRLINSTERTAYLSKSKSAHASKDSLLNRRNRRTMSDRVSDMSGTDEWEYTEEWEKRDRAALGAGAHRMGIGSYDVLDVTDSHTDILSRLRYNEHDTGEMSRADERSRMISSDASSGESRQAFTEGDEFRASTSKNSRTWAHTAEMSDEEVDDKVSHAGHLYTKKNTVADMFWMAGTAIYAFMVLVVQSCWRLGTFPFMAVGSLLARVGTYTSEYFQQKSTLEQHQTMSSHTAIRGESLGSKKQFTKLLKRTRAESVTHGTNGERLTHIIEDGSEQSWFMWWLSMLTTPIYSIYSTLTSTSAEAGWETTESVSALQTDGGGGGIMGLITLLSSPFLWLGSTLLGMWAWFAERVWITYHVLKLTSVGEALVRGQWWVGQWLYNIIITLVHKDVWLLSRTGGRRGCGCCFLPLLLLLPLLLSGGYYASTLSREVLMAHIPQGFSTLYLGQLVKQPVLTAGVLTDEDLHQRVHAILVSLEKEREIHTREQIILERTGWQQQQQEKETSHKEQLILLEQRLQEWAKQRIDESVAAGAALSAADRASQQQNMDNVHGQQTVLLTLLQQEMQATNQKIQALKDDLIAAQLGVAGVSSSDDAAVARVSSLEEQLILLQGEIGKLQAAHAALLLQTEKCCYNETALAALVYAATQKNIAAMLGTDGFGDGGDGVGVGGTAGFAGWLHSQFVKQHDLSEQLRTLSAKLEGEHKDKYEAALAAAIEAAEQKASVVAAAIVAASLADKSNSKETHQERMDAFVAPLQSMGLSEQQVIMLINQQLSLLAADKTGQVDFALESAGGSVVGTRCSQTYHRNTAQLSLFGIPLWYFSNSARTVIQPEVHPGQCWAFHGTEGYLVLQLAGHVRPTGFTLEHIPKALSPTGKIDSAPKGFTVWGLADEYATDGLLLGNYTYDQNGPPLQSFPVTTSNPGVFHFVELRIHTNHGNLEYTCLYRFRVHGELHQW